MTGKTYNCYGCIHRNKFPPFSLLKMYLAYNEFSEEVLLLFQEGILDDFLNGRSHYQLPSFKAYYEFSVNSFHSITWMIIIKSSYNKIKQSQMYMNLIKVIQNT